MGRRVVDDVASRVRAPSLALWALAALSAGAHGVLFAYTAYVTGSAMWGGVDPGWGEAVVRGGVAIGGFVGTLMLVMAARALSQMRSLNTVWVGVVAAAVPCCSGVLWPVGLAIAGWIAFILQDEEVRASFGDSA